jgi:hypothetical protein
MNQQSEIGQGGQNEDGSDKQAAFPLEELEITFKQPIQLGQTTYEKILLVEPTAGQYEKASNAGNAVGVMIQLICFVAKVPRKVVEQMKGSDFAKCSDFLGTFSKTVPET